MTPEEIKNNNLSIDEKRIILVKTMGIVPDSVIEKLFNDLINRACDEVEKTFYSNK